LVLGFRFRFWFLVGFFICVYGVGKKIFSLWGQIFDHAPG
jgi:hypothetical protein